MCKGAYNPRLGVYVFNAQVPETLQNYHTENAFDVMTATEYMRNRFSAGLRNGRQATLVALVDGELQHIARIRLAHSAYSSIGSGYLEFFHVPELGLNDYTAYYVPKARFGWDGEPLVLALLQKCFDVSCKSDGYKIQEALRKIAEYFKLKTYTIVNTIT